MSDVHSELRRIWQEKLDKEYEPFRYNEEWIHGREAFILNPGDKVFHGIPLRIRDTSRFYDFAHNKDPVIGVNIHGLYTPNSEVLRRLYELVKQANVNVEPFELWKLYHSINDCTIFDDASIDTRVLIIERKNGLHPDLFDTSVSHIYTEEQAEKIQEE